MRFLNLSGVIYRVLLLLSSLAMFFIKIQIELSVCVQGRANSLKLTPGPDGICPINHHLPPPPPPFNSEEAEFLDVMGQKSQEFSILCYSQSPLLTEQKWFGTGLQCKLCTGKHQFCEL